jgi:hypothetical protein
MIRYEGDAFFVETNCKKIPKLVYAPTMFIPVLLGEGSQNALFATIAAMKTALTVSDEIYMPVFCVNSGGMFLEHAVDQMVLGIDFVLNKRNISTHQDLEFLYKQISRYN